MIRKRYSFPKQKIRVLLLENIHPEGQEILRGEGYQVEALEGALDEAELAERIRGVHILGIRSKTQVTAKVLSQAEHLLTIGAFCIGTNQIYLTASAAHGVVVFNAPFQNTRSVVELAVADIIALHRRILEKNAATHAGIWDKSAKGAHEVRGRKLGIVGYGHIGSQLSVVAEALGMQVYYYDLADTLAFGNAKRVGTLRKLLETVDVVSVHVDGRAGNKALIGEAEFEAMKPGSLFLNLARGFVVDEAALVRHLKSGHLGGAALDVFEAEPKKRGEPFESKLRGLPNVILTPHVASGTEEAQAEIGRFVGGKLVSFVNAGTTAMSVNMPAMMLPEQEGSHRLILIHTNVPGVLAKVNTLMAQKGVNIIGQYLGTSGTTGYVITDIDSTYEKGVVSALRELPETIKLRILY